MMRGEGGGEGEEMEVLLVLTDSFLYIMMSDLGDDKYMKDAPIPLVMRQHHISTLRRLTIWFIIIMMFIIL